MDQEEGSGNHGKRPLEEAGEEFPVVVVPEAKKQWKSPAQIKILEDTYGVDSKPSASMKKELARRTGLGYKQVQYWFGNRRYIDRHGPRKYNPRRKDEISGQSEPRSSQDMSMALVVAPNAILQMTGSIGNADTSLSWRNSQLQMYAAANSLPQGSIPEIPLTALQPFAKDDLYFAFNILENVEKMLGYPLMTYLPVLGKEFRPLPPDAFDSLIESTGVVMTSEVPENSRNIQRPSPELAQETVALPNSATPFTSNTRAFVAPQDVHKLHLEHSPAAIEYQFFPTQPSQSEDNERVPDTAEELGHEIVSSDDRILAANSLSGSILAAKLVRAFQLSTKTNIQNVNAFTTKKIQTTSLGSHMMNGIEHSAQISMPTTVSYKKKCTSAGPSSDYLSISEENGGSAQKIGEKTKDNCDQGKGYQLPLVRGHDQFFVRPRIGPFGGRSVLDEGTGMQYFADATVAPVVAEWHENEGKTVYSIDLNERCLSDLSAGQALGSSQCLGTSKPTVVDVDSQLEATCKEGHDKQGHDEDDDEMTDD